jgi:PPM family protein phosphatase
MRLLCTAATFSEVGKRRPHMEDRFFLSSEPSPVLAAVADGMSKPPHGEVIAQIAVDCLNRHHGVRSFASEPAAVESRLTAAFADAQSEASAYGTSAAYLQQMPAQVILNGNWVPWYKRPGTTLVVTVFDGASLHVMWIGDSRLYRGRKGKVDLLTLDHNPLRGYVPFQRTSTEHRFGKSNVLDRHLGCDVARRPMGSTPEYWREDVEPGDVFLLCTDGVSSELDSAPGAQLERLLLSGLAPADMCGELAAAVMLTEARDNATGIGLHFAGI